MNNDPTKVSFIPKNSLIGRNVVMRRRPRSTLGVVAGVFFFGNIVAYLGIQGYALTLNDKIKEKKEVIIATREEFRKSPVISEAKTFQSRTRIGEELLKKHIVVSPLFKFLEENTLQTVHFESLKFTHGGQGSRVALKGEVLGYASLAYQADVLKEKNTELLGFNITDVKLTTTGNVSFSLEEVLVPSFVAYAKGVKEVDAPAISVPANSSEASEPLPVVAEGVSSAGASATLKVTDSGEKVPSLTQKFLNLFK